MCKDFGGLGIPNLRDLNLCLLGSWVKRYHNDGGKLWKEVIDFKYNTRNPNLFDSKSVGASEFFKGVICAAQAAKMGFRWQIGNGKLVKFWEDNWLGNSSLAIQYWELYEIVNEKAGTVFDLWDKENLKCTFRRTVGQKLMNDWLEVKQLASAINFTSEEDSLIWMFSSKGVYSSQTLYKIINFRGVTQIHVSAVWKLVIPPRVQFLLWLLSKNRNLTRDVLESRGKLLEDNTCLFCTEREISHHLFFDCVVARHMWCVISELLNLDIGSDFESIGGKWLSNKRFLILKIGSDFESIGGKWLSNKRFLILNMCTSASLWCLWKLRNDMHFQNTRWRSMEVLLLKIAGTLQNWIILCPGNMKDSLSSLVEKLRKNASRPQRITG